MTDADRRELLAQGLTADQIARAEEIASNPKDRAEMLSAIWGSVRNTRLFLSGSSGAAEASALEKAEGQLVFATLCAKMDAKRLELAAGAGRGEAQVE